MTDEHLITIITDPADLPAQRAAQPPTAPALVYLASLQSANSRATMRRQLDQIAQLLGYQDCIVCPWYKLRAQHTTAIQAQLAGQYSPATANLMVAAVRGILRACRRLGLISADDYANAIDLKRITGEGASAASGRSLSQQERNRRIAACVADTSPAGARDAAILALASATGARRAELVALDLADVLTTDMGYTVTIRGKGNTPRTAYLVGTFAVVLGDWLAVRGAAAGPLFTRIQTGGRPDRTTDQPGNLPSHESTRGCGGTCHVQPTRSAPYLHLQPPRCRHRQCHRRRHRRPQQRADNGTL
jgi:integrase